MSGNQYITVILFYSFSSPLTAHSNLQAQNCSKYKARDFSCPLVVPEGDAVGVGPTIYVDRKCENKKDVFRSLLLMCNIREAY